MDHKGKCLIIFIMIINIEISVHDITLKARPQIQMENRLKRISERIKRLLKNNKGKVYSELTSPGTEQQNNGPDIAMISSPLHGKLVGIPYVRNASAIPFNSQVSIDFEANRHVLLR